jgi:HSP20 family protein
MNLIRYNPLKQKNTLPGFFEDFFNKNLSDFVGNDFTSNTPSVNIIEEDDIFRIEVAAPGLTRKDFSIEIKDDRLLVSGKREMKTEENEEGKYRRREFNYSSFSRSFYIPETVNQDEINANYDNGVLSISLNKLGEVAKPVSKVIKIK